MVLKYCTLLVSCNSKDTKEESFIRQKSHLQSIAGRNLGCDPNLCQTKREHETPSCKECRGYENLEVLYFGPIRILPDVPFPQKFHFSKHMSDFSPLTARFASKVETPITNQAPIKEGCTYYVHQNLLLEIGHRQLLHLKFDSKFNTINKILKKLAFSIFSISAQRKNIHLHMQPEHVS